MGHHKQSHLKNARKKRVIVCEDLNYIWDQTELNKIAKFWNQSGDIRIIANYFNRDPDEVVIAIIHLARIDKINRRKGGLLLE